MNITGIPDLCLLKIFDSVPLKNVLVSVPLVCRRWRQLVQPSAIARRRELLLMITDRANRPKNLADHDLLWLLTRKATSKSALKMRLDWIERSFNSVSSLTIMHSMGNPRLLPIDTDNALLPSINLIVNMSSRLVKLSLTSNLPMVRSTILFHYINHGMPQLRVLILELSERSPLPNWLKPLFVLKQLTHFKLRNSKIYFEDLNKRVLMYAEEGCDQLKRFEFEGLNSIGTRDWLKVDPNAAKKITEIDELFSNWINTPFGMYNHLLGYRTVRKLTRLFTSLTTVALIVNQNLSIVQVFSCLRSLTQLKIFNLAFKEQNISNGLRRLAQFQLPTVEHIIWDCSLTNHQQLFDSFNFAHLFPRLKLAWICYREAADCSICKKLGYSTRDCAQAMCDAFTGGHHNQLCEVKIKAADKDEYEEQVVVKWMKV